MKDVRRAEMRIRQLCCLGLPSEQIMPALLGELHALVPAYANNFWWTDAVGNCANVYQENFDETAAVLPVFFSEFYNNDRMSEVLRNVPASVLHDRGVKTLDQLLNPSVDRRAFYRHDYYQLIHKPSGYHNMLSLVVREGARPLGMVAVHRDAKAPEFSEREQRRLAGLEAFIAHAVSTAAPREVQLASVADEHGGMIVVDRQARIQFASPHARRLLYLATHPRPPTNQAAALTMAKHLPAAVIRMCRNLTAVFEAQTEEVPPPVHHHRNPWGGFVFKAYWLDNGDPRASLIGITIEHHVPLAVKLVRRMAHLPALSPRQMQVCLLLVAGHSHAEIARRMDMSTNTATTHCRRLYDRLDVHNRAELMEKLLGV